jgi:hypothetical protein
MGAALRTDRTKNGYRMARARSLNRLDWRRRVAEAWACETPRPSLR